ncbi:hypothetical protein FK220_005120 [Flavobacteriaceae bacterium TP-CH-4]|uniref:Uncharacterized protein n=1 Tax=Pelagihabitans pacificus TaxID=2696054 RepID=A0A967AQV9_9FLAO|nr:hypothetical protein [Pelagihabitans pacificus]NHF58709.1 hypothetical protein [Pelagihabitans pacificus]
MAKEKLEVIREAELKNNCPECFNQELALTFYQKHKYGKLFHRTTGEVTHQITCNKCGSHIYPAKWTDDIERIFEYYQKMVTPEKASIKFTNLFYGLVLFLVVLVGAGTYLFLEGIIQF